MSRVFTTPAAEQSARAWFHDVALAAGITTKNLKPNTPYMLGRTSWQAACATICDELVNRDFADIDQALRAIEDAKFYANGKWKKFDKATIAKAIVYIAESLQLYWDDTVRTPYEIDAFKSTFLGMAVYKYGRYISAVPTSGTKARSTSNAGGGQPPKNNYKQSGPQSANVRDLLSINGGAGTPGEKVYANGSLIYKIIGDSQQSKNIPNVFIKPLSKSGAHGTTNKIFISSGNGYTDCTCYFDDPNDAQAMLDKIIADNRVPNGITNLRVVKMKADSNGYFYVGTEYGPCAISAKTLNEALAESIDSDNSQPGGWEKATEGYNKDELNELHTWMRRG